jgi:Rrf2 family protein
MHGGYRLARPPAEITVAEVFQALDGAPTLVRCVDEPSSCPMANTCLTRDTWVALTDALVGVLENRTLKDLVDRGERTTSSARVARRVEPSAKTTQATTGLEA